MKIVQAVLLLTLLLLTPLQGSPASHVGKLSAEVGGEPMADEELGGGTVDATAGLEQDVAVVEEDDLNGVADETHAPVDPGDVPANGPAEAPTNGEGGPTGGGTNAELAFAVGGVPVVAANPNVGRPYNSAANPGYEMVPLINNTLPEWTNPPPALNPPQPTTMWNRFFQSMASNPCSASGAVPDYFMRLLRLISGDNFQDPHMRALINFQIEELCHERSSSDLCQRRLAAQRRKERRRFMESTKNQFGFSKELRKGMYAMAETETKNRLDGWLEEQLQALRDAIWAALMRAPMPDGSGGLPPLPHRRDPDNDGDNPRGGSRPRLTM